MTRFSSQNTPLWRHNDVLPALRCRFGLDSSELLGELEFSSTCNTVSDSRWKPAFAFEFLLRRKACWEGTASYTSTQTPVTLRTTQWKPKRKMSRLLQICCMKQTFKSPISQLISARDFWEKSGGFEVLVGRPWEKPKNREGWQVWESDWHGQLTRMKFKRVNE